MISWQLGIMQTCDNFATMPFRLEQLAQVVAYMPFLSGSKVRLVLSNLYGEADLCFDEIYLSKEEKFHVKHQVTYLKQKQVVIRRGHKLQTDPLTLKVQAGEKLYVWMKASRKQTYADVASTYATDLINASYGQKFDYCPSLRVNEHQRKSWFSLEGVLVWTKHKPKVVEFAGDSLMEMGFVSQALGKLFLEEYPQQVTYLNSAVSGSRLLYDCPTDSPLLATYGQSLLKRKPKPSSVALSICFCGGNDLLLPAYSSQASKQVVTPAELVAGFRELLTSWPNPVVSSTILPAKKIQAQSEATRLAVNQELSSWSQIFDGAKLLVDGQGKLKPIYQLGDGLHINQAGGNLLAQQLLAFLKTNSLL